MADIDLTPTEEMASNAARGLELREKHGRGGTAVGVARARDIKNRKNLSPDTVRRMHSFFSRHAGNEAGGEDDAGYISFLLWGGAAGRSWAKRKSAQLDKDENAMSDTRKEIMERLGMAAHPGAKAAFATEVGRKGNKAAMISRDPNGGWKAWVVQRGSTGIGQFEDILGRMRSYATEEKAKRAVIAALDTSGFSRPGAKAKFGLEVGEAFEFEGKVYVVNSNADKISFLLSSLRSNSEKAMMLAGYMFKGWISYEGKRKSSRPGAKAKMAAASDIIKMAQLLADVERAMMHDQPEKARNLLKQIEPIVERNKDSRELDSQGMVRAFNDYKKQLGFSRPGAKAKMARIAGNSLVLDSGDVFKITEWDDLSNAAPAIRDVISKAGVVTDKKGRMWYLRIRKNGTFVLQVPTAGGQTIQGRMESSRPGAKAKFGVSVGDRVRGALAVKGGAGIVGTVTKIEDDYAYITADASASDKYGAKTYKVPMRLVTKASRPGAKAKFGITNAASAFLKKMLREYASMKGTRWYDEAKYISDNPTEHTDADVIAAVGNLKLAKSVSSRPGAKAHNAIREGEKVSASDDAVSRKIRKLMDEGKPQKQAVAIALDLERRGEL
jgi:hypothetical protein